ncbi:MAG: amidohydrolase [ANME-2 cluster archaeon]|nr:MAG: amidohydrolase [ANME-2 cluster archaeon]
MLPDHDNGDIRDWIIEKRREFHRIPELSFFEFKTKEMVLEILQEIGLDGKAIAKTGVVAMINGKCPGKTIALRADMDGLEVTEEASQLNREYISQHPGFMHSCGHDGHMAIVLGAARLLSQCQDSFQGSVKFIFQPGEEQPPGGALEVINEGGLDEVDAIVGHHIFSSINSGEIKVKPGPFMATSNIMTVRIIGKGGHHLDPGLYIDPISIASKFVGLIRDEIKKQIPEDRFIIGFGKISGGSQFNRTPDEVEILGSFRTFNKNDTRLIKDIINHTLENIMQSYSRAEYPGLPKFELDILHGYPVLINEPVFSNQVLKVLKRGFPDVDDDIDPFFGAEDFAYYLQKVPGVYIGLGTRNEEKGIIEGNHSSRFDIDEDILLIGAKMLTTIVLDFLNNPEEYLA